MRKRMALDDKNLVPLLPAPSPDELQIRSNPTDSRQWLRLPNRFDGGRDIRGREHGRHQV